MSIKTKKDSMQTAIINIPDGVPSKVAQEAITKVELELKKIAETVESEPKEKELSSINDDPWSNPDIELPSVDTGIPDLAENHDHYLYGTPKRS